jgi:hypothetical protein
MLLILAYLPPVIVLATGLWAAVEVIKFMKSDGDN